jgi:hypothetical protein
MFHCRTGRLMPVAALAAMALTLPLAADAAAAPEPDAAAAAAPDAGDGVRLWYFGAGRGAGMAADLARRYDVVIGVNGLAGQVGQMRSINPGVLVAPYEKGTSVIGTDFQWVQANHPEWFLKNAGGGLIRSTFGAYLLNPVDPGVRAWQQERARQAQSQGWTALYYDSLGTFGIEGPDGVAINPASGRPFTDQEWLNATSGLAGAIDQAVSVPVLVNGLRSGVGYWGGARELLNGSQGGVFEACFRDANAPLGSFGPEGAWESQVRAIEDTQAHGDIALCMVKAWGGGGSHDQWHDFALASFLLADNGRAFFHFDATAKGGPPADSSVPIGRPAGPRAAQGGAWVRDFTRGAVAVNPTGGAVQVTVGGQTLTLAPHTGQIGTG